jgi:DNA-binding FadR family transcriptional regulator
VTEQAVKYDAGPRFSAARRPHAADHVFEQLATAILRGELQVGAPLPPEYNLASRFHVSRIIVRQAVHQLAEIGLVRVRQGGSTIILDPRGAHDLRVLDLEWRLGPGSPADLLDYTERQIMQGHAILHIAERRGTKAQLSELAMIVEVYAPEGGTAEGMPAFEERFWRAATAASGNRLFQFEVNWWFRLVSAHPRSLHPILAPPHARIASFREIVRRMAHGENGAQLYLDLAMKLLDSVAAKLKAEAAAAAPQAAAPIPLGMQPRPRKTKDR